MSNKAYISSVKKLLKESLVIPNYQRPYKWTPKNIEELLLDINTAIENKDRLSENFKYRIGTVILHENNDKFAIVDGQQRIISLALVCDVLGKSDYCKSINKADKKSDTYKVLNEKTTLNNINKNKEFITDWFCTRKNKKEEFIKAMNSLLEVVVITVTEQAEAFQLFDSQNSRGKTLDPHDLLKAYHLREMKEKVSEMEEVVRNWESTKSSEIRTLFNCFLFPIYNWCNNLKDKEFTAKEINLYKGVKESLPYTYVDKVKKTMPIYQIIEPFIAGEEFFKYVDHYILTINYLRKALYEEDVFAPYKKIILDKNNNLENFHDEELSKKASSIYYAFNLFLSVFLLYYDKFHNFDEVAIKKLFIWAFMIRVDMEKLGYDTINKYALGEDNNDYSNKIPMFKLISLARNHSEISNLQISTEGRRGKLNKKDTWFNLQNNLNSLKMGDSKNG